jgi:outer membrane receptor protein involved in Fe transport
MQEAAVAAIMCGVSATGALAQEAAPSDASGTALEEITVIAQRRAENLQDVPVSVSAVTAAKLESAGINGIADLSVAVPSLNIGNGNGYLITHLRGIGTIANGPGIENPVALYVDGVYYANQTVGLFSFNNISQIEVLKGPQGTLFGRNATGGLIQILTDDPSQQFKLKASIGASNFRGIDGSAYISGGLAPDLAADFAVEGSRRDGWGRNEATGQEVYAVPWDLAFRSKWIYNPDNWKITFIGDYSNTLSSNNALGLAAGSYAIRGVTPPASYSQPWDVDTNEQPRIQNINGGGSLKVEYDFDAFDISNLAAYRKSKLDNLFDYDGTALPLTGVRIQQHDWQYSDELQLSSRSSGPLKWVAGAYYFRAMGEINPNTIIFASDPVYNPVFPVGNILVDGITHTTSISGYAQATYDILESLSVTGGARYSRENRHYAGDESALLLVPAPPVPLVPPVSASESFSDPTYRLALSYKPVTDLMVYASVNTGFKSGGFNTTAPTDPGFLPEKLTAYEVGEKADLFDHRVRLNTSGFYYNYTDIQTQKPEATGSGIINGGRAHLYGLDTDLTVIPVRNLELSASLSLLHTEYVSFPNAPISTPGGGVAVVDGSATGNQLPYSPKVTLDLGATYTIPLPNSGSLVLTGQYQHNSGFYFESDNVASQDEFQLFNASVRWKSADEHYSLLFYGDNLADKAIYSVIITTPSGQQIAERAAPRTYGVRFTYQY